MLRIVERVIDHETEEEAETEHDLARDGIAKLRELSAAPGFGAAVDMLAAGIKHHVEEEEQEVFPELRQKAGDERAALAPEQLQAGVEWATRQFYRLGSIARRLAASRQGLWWNLPRNLGYKLAFDKLRRPGRNPATEADSGPETEPATSRNR